MQWPVIKCLRRRLICPVYRLVGTGLPILRPLRKHILVCGFPRSGTTRRFGNEFSGWRAATYAWRNHDVVISKMPHDLFRLDSGYEPDARWAEGYMTISQSAGTVTAIRAS